MLPVVLPALRHFDEALALELADLDVVERHVVVRAAAEREPVVVDDATPASLALSMHALPESGSRLVAMRTLTPSVIICRRAAVRVGRALGVLDVRLDARGLERGLEVRAVLRLPAHRRLRVGQDHADLARPRRCHCCPPLASLPPRCRRRTRQGAERRTPAATRDASALPCFLTISSTSMARTGAGRGHCDVTRRHAGMLWRHNISRCPDVGKRSQACFVARSNQALSPPERDRIVMRSRTR